MAMSTTLNRLIYLTGAYHIGKPIYAAGKHYYNNHHKEE